MPTLIANLRRISYCLIDRQNWLESIATIRNFAQNDRMKEGLVENGDLMGVETTIPLGALEGLVGYHLRRANIAFATDFSRVMHDKGIRQSLFGVLSVVRANPGTNQGAVGRALGIKRANMVALINELIELNLIERRAASKDRRAFALTLTSTGQSKFLECLQQIQTHEETLLSGINAQQKGALIKSLMLVAADKPTFGANG